MQKILLTQNNKTIDITSFVSTVSWSGGKTQAARKLEIGMINSVVDKYAPNLYINNGSLLKLINDNKTLFEGFVFFNERAGQKSVVYVTAYDRLIYMLKSKAVYNFENKTAEEITSLVCTHFQIPVGTISKTGAKQSFIANGKSLYDIIMQAYTGASKINGKKYMPKMIDGKLNIIEVGNKLCSIMLTDTTNITDSGYTESIENMVNRIKIHDDKGTQIGIVENVEWIKKYGLLQDVYTKEKDKRFETVAKTMLEGVRKDINVECLGNIECVSGNGVHVRDSLTGLTGLFYIDSDTHTWQNGQHIMRLVLNFKKIMDERK